VIVHLKSHLPTQRQYRVTDDATLAALPAHPALIATLTGPAVCGDAGQQLTRQEWATYVPGLAYHAPC
jgi:hypothetical protein